MLIDRPNLTWLLAAMLLLGASSPGGGESAPQGRYCLSGICPGDSRNVLSHLTLSDLSHIAERPRGRSRDFDESFRAAIPGLSDVERKTLTSYTDSTGSLLLDPRTLPIFLKIDRICAPVVPFVALFMSESGHPSIVEYGALPNGTDVRLGVTRVARLYRVDAGSSEERSLIADLSRNFGFAIDGSRVAELKDRGRGVTAQFTRQEDGFTLAFFVAALREDAHEYSEQAGCDRIKID